MIYFYIRVDEYQGHHRPRPVGQCYNITHLKYMSHLLYNPRAIRGIHAFLLSSSLSGGFGGMENVADACSLFLVYSQLATRCGGTGLLSLLQWSYPQPIIAQSVSYIMDKRQVGKKKIEGKRERVLSKSGISVYRCHSYAHA